MKKVTILLVTVFCITVIFAQNPELNNLETIGSAPRSIEEIKYPYEFTYNGNPLSRIHGAADPYANVWDGQVWVYCSMAVRITTQNTEGNSSSVAMNCEPVDNSAHGYGRYTFSFYAKAAAELTVRPFWMNVEAYDQDGAIVTKEVVAKIDNGGTSQKEGMESGSVQHTVSVDIHANRAGGNDAKKIALKIQMGKPLPNTFWFDDFTLSGPAAS